MGIECYYKSLESNVLSYNSVCNCSIGMSLYALWHGCGNLTANIDTAISASATVSDSLKPYGCQWFSLGDMFLWDSTCLLGKHPLISRVHIISNNSVWVSVLFAECVIS